MLSFDLLHFSSLLFATIKREIEQEFAQLEQTHRSSDLVNAAVLFRHFNKLYWFSTAEKHRFRYIQRTPHVSAIIRPSKFLNKPAEVLLLITIVVALFKFSSRCSCDSLHFCSDALRNVRCICTCSLVFDLLQVVLNFLVEALHSFIAVYLLVQELVLLLFCTDKIFDSGVGALHLYDVEVLYTDATSAAEFLTLF